MPRLTRREFFKRSSLFSLTATFAGTGLTISRTSHADTVHGAGKFGVKALIFDAFGTLVDWRSSVSREAKKILQPLGYNLDWLAFADAWRAEYQPGMEEIRSGRQPFSRLDVVHRGMLERIRPKFGLENVDDAVLSELNMAWHKLDAWCNVSNALHRLRHRYLLGPCSNGNFAIMVDLARRNNFPWDAILGAELAGDYKPKLRVYQVAAEALGVEYSQCMMVAAHSNDLKFAAQAGLRTGFVSQPDEFGPGKGEREPNVRVDVAAHDFQQFADIMLS